MDYAEFRHVGIVVRDIDRCLWFYRRLGLEVLVDYEESAPLIGELLGIDLHSIRIVKLGRPPETACVELLVFDPVVEAARPPLNGTGVTHFALTVESVDALYEANEGRWSFLSEPRVSFDGRVKLVFCRDPEGNVIELVSTRPQSQAS